MSEQAVSQSRKRMNIHSNPNAEDDAALPIARPNTDVLSRLRSLAVARPLRLAPFRLLWAGEAASLLADQLFFITLLVLVLQVAGPGAELGSLLAVAAIPGAVLLPLGGWLSDRFPRARIMAITSSGRAVLMAALAGLLLLGDISLWQLYLLGGLLSTLDAFYYPASLAIVPTLVEETQLEPANALIQGAEQVSGALGPALAAALVAGVGLGATFGVVTLIFACAAAMFARMAAGMQVTSAANPAGAAEESGLAAMLAGARYAWRDPLIRLLLLIVAALNVAAAGPLVVGVALLATERLGGPGALGVLYTAFGVGSLLGVGAAGLLGQTPRRGPALLALTALFGLGTAALGWASSLPLAAAIAALLGTGGGYLGVVLTSWLQERVAPEFLGRVMSLVVLAAVALDPISYTLTGILAAGGAERLFLLAGGVMLLVAALASFSRTIRRFD